MFIFSRESSTRSLGGKGSLSPGANFPKDALWERFARTAVILHLIQRGTLQVCSDDTADLGMLDSDGAIALAAATKDPVRLARWLKAERRPTVLEALQVQVKRYPLPEEPSDTAPITGPDGSREEDTVAEDPEAPSETSAQDPSDEKPPKPPKAPKAANPPKPPKPPKAGKNAPADAPPAAPPPAE